MKRFGFIACFLIPTVLSAIGQGLNIELTFTAVNDTAYARLDSIRVINKSVPKETMLYYPDTVLTILNVGINENQKEKNDFLLYPNYPNPCVDNTLISFYIPDRDDVTIHLSDLSGKQVISSVRNLLRGVHRFSFNPGKSRVYMCSICYKGVTKSIKIINFNVDGPDVCELKYIHSEEVDHGPLLKESEDEFWYGIGDQLLCIGYINGIPSGIPDSPESSTTYTFQFAVNIPCPGMPFINFEGQTYNTIQILSQCWLKENLNAGSRIPGSSEMTDNQITEKWCHSDLDSNCNLYGGLYSWRESMDYAVSEGSRGLCPPGWHIPTLEETRVLNGAADSQFGIGDAEWDKFGQRGYDAGYNLKSTWSWLYNFNGSDLFGFSALGASYRTGGGNFWILGDDADFWTSSGNDQSQVYVMGLNFWNEMVYSFPTTIENNASAGYSVRCLRDN